MIIIKSFKLLFLVTILLNNLIPMLNGMEEYKDLENLLREDASYIDCQTYMPKNQLTNNNNEHKRSREEGGDDDDDDEKSNKKARICAEAVEEQYQSTTDWLEKLIGETFPEDEDCGSTSNYEILQQEIQQTTNNNMLERILMDNDLQMQIRDNASIVAHILSKELEVTENIQTVETTKDPAQQAKTKQLIPCKCKCGKCKDFVFEYIEDLTKHINEKHPIDEAPCKCTICPTTFKKISELSEHIKKFSYDKKVHTQEKRQKVEHKLYGCNYQSCLFTSSHKSLLIVHARLHKQQLLYACPHCFMAFAQSSNLKKHIKTHTNTNTENESFVCNFDLGNGKKCTREFFSLPFLTKHRDRAHKNT